MNTRNDRGIGRAAAAYVTAILSLSAGLLLWEWARADACALLPDATAVTFWLFLSLAAECFWLETPSGHGMVSMSLAVNLASVFVLPPALVLTVGALSVGLSDLLLHRRGWLRAGFNAAQTSLSLAACLRVMGWLGAGGGSAVLLHAPLAALSVPVVFFAVNSVLVSIVISLHQGLRFGRAWRENFGFGYQVVSSAALFFLGVLLVVACETIGYVSGLMVLVFFHVLRSAYRRINQERRSSSALSGSPADL